MRRLDEHLSPEELVNLSKLEEAGSAAGDRNLLEHVDQCEACAELVETHTRLRNLRADADAATGPACPEQMVWVEFAAGLRPDEAEFLVAHAVSCAHCADLLKEAIEVMQADNSEPLPEALASATPAWQQRVARQMASVTHAEAPAARRFAVLQGMRSRPAWTIMALAAALLIAAILIGVHWRSSSTPSESGLLAQAYNKQRTLALRIPGAEPVAMASITRGASDGLAKPSALLELELRTQKHLEETPNSPYWHQVLGEIQIVEHDGAAARHNLDIAQDGDHTLPNLLQDLAAAAFEVGDSTGNAVEFARAAELYSEQLRAPNADKPMLLYNRALCWERQNLKSNALDDLRAALAAEGSAAWRAAIQAEIERLSAPPSASAAPLELDGYEASLADATEKLLPQWSDSADARAKIREIAALGLRHHDRWLNDWIDATHTTVSAEADKLLASAVSAGDAGQAESSLDEAGRAVALYKQVNHQPGMLRAELAEAYALQRLSNGKDCLQAIADVRRGPGAAGDAWIDAQSTLETAICEVTLGDLPAAQKDYDRGMQLTVAAQLPMLRLRALAGEAFILAQRGSTSAAWNRNVSGLSLCELARCPALREYSFLYDMVRGAETLGLTNVAEQVMRTAEQISAHTGDETARTYALESLATLSGRNGDFEEASRGFGALDQLKESGNRVAAVKLYRAEWDTDRAELLTRRGDPQQALAVLERSAPAILASSYQPGRVGFFHQLANAHDSLHHFDEALANARSAVAETEASLAGMHSPLTREQWSQANAPIYEQLVKIYLQRGDASAALRAWERFRRAPYTAAQAANSAPQEAQSIAVLVIARVDDSYIGWVADSHSLQPLLTVNLGDAAALQRSAVSFYRLCADRDSTVADIHRVGGHLYRSLLQPLTGTTGFQSGHLFVDIDPTLAMLPVAALTLPDGEWLGDTQQVTVLSPWWSISPGAVAEKEAITPAMKMVIVSGFDRTSLANSEAEQLTRLFPRATLLAASDSTPDKVARTLASASLFHFAGHASAPGEPAVQHADITLSDALTPEAVAAVRLEGFRLAVLAACNTTAADPDRMEKLPDLRNALLLSGAHAVVASSWDVDDHSTHELMIHFYNHLLTGQLPAQALQHAQHEIESTAAWQHPYFWAAFQTFTN